MMKVALYFVTLMMFLGACNSKLSKEAFLEWYQRISPVVKSTENHVFTIRYFPAEILMMDKVGITEYEINKESKKIWVTIDIEKKKYFPSSNSHSKLKSSLDVIKITLNDKNPSFKINEYSTGNGIEGRWIYTWDQVEISKNGMLTIKLNEESFSVSTDQLLPPYRPTLKL